jgi:hypothetical protein
MGNVQKNTITDKTHHRQNPLDFIDESLLNTPINQNGRLTVHLDWEFSWIPSVSLQAYVRNNN